MTEPRRRPTLGILSLATGVIALGSVTMIVLTSNSADFNPPDWVRIATMAPLPFAIIASLALGAASFARRAGRVWAAVGVSVTAIAVAWFVVVISAAA